MSMLARRRLAITVLIFALFGAVYWTWDHYQQSHRLLQTAVTETENCRQLAALLQQRQEGAPVERVEMPEEQLFQRVSQAATAAGLQTDRVIRSIRPQAARTVRGSPYQQKNVELSLQGLTLEQLVQFLYGLRSANPQLQIAALTLHEPKGLGPATLWNVQPLVLTYRIAGAAAKTENP